MVTLLLSLLIVIELFIILIILKKNKGGINMVDMYVALVIAGRRTCNPENKEVPLVPTRYRAKVLTELEALGLDADGNPKE